MAKRARRIKKVEEAYTSLPSELSTTMLVLTVGSTTIWWPLNTHGTQTKTIRSTNSHRNSGSQGRRFIRQSAQAIGMNLLSAVMTRLRRAITQYSKMHRHATSAVRSNIEHTVENKYLYIIHLRDWPCSIRSEGRRNGQHGFSFPHDSWMRCCSC
jgi:hypothetical protein